MPAWLLPAAIAGLTTGASIFARDRESRLRRQRIDNLSRQIEANRQKRLAEAKQQIQTYTAGLRKSGEARAQRIALASGREGQAEALTPVITGRVARAGSAALERAITNINEQADREKMNLEYDRASEPIEPGLFDYVSEIGQGAGRFLALQEMMAPERSALAQDAHKDFKQELEADIDRDLTSEFAGDEAYQLGRERRRLGRARRLNRFSLSPDFSLD